jgi:hypothetical protein
MGATVKIKLRVFVPWVNQRIRCNCAWSSCSLVWRAASLAAEPAALQRRAAPAAAEPVALQMPQSARLVLSSQTACCL